MTKLLFVMLGGAFGAGARHLTSRALLNLLGPGFPWGTLAVNLLGGLLMGVLAGVLARAPVPGENWRLLLGVGVLGGFTTFSAFSLELVLMFQRGDWGLAFAYAAGSVLGAAMALFAGLMVVRALA